MVSKISLPCSDFISLHTALSPVASPFRPSPIYSDSRLHRGVTALTRRAKLPKLPGGIHQVPRSTGAPILSPQPQQLLQLFFFPALPSFFFLPLFSLDQRTGLPQRPFFRGSLRFVPPDSGFQPANLSRCAYYILVATTPEP
jgi:hypothetical protein